MAETAGQIEIHIQKQRDELRSHLDELEQKVRSAIDWRRHYVNHTGTALVAALGAGLLLSRVVGGRNSRSGGGAKAAPRPSSLADHGQMALSNTLNAFKGALIGVAFTHAKDVINKLIPGFSRHLPENLHPVSRSAKAPPRDAPL